MKKYKNIEHYVNLPWTYTITPAKDESGGHFYILCVNELQGICTDAPTVQEGMELIKEAIEGAIELYMELGKEIPEPIDEEEYKGNISYRTSSRRHYLIAQEAQRRGKSLSKTIDEIIDQIIRR